MRINYIRVVLWPWYSNETFHFFFTKYTRPRNLYFASSTDGITWTEDKELTRFGGHYQVSGVHPESNRIATFFNYHPESNVDRRTNVYYMESADGGMNWIYRPILPPLNRPHNPPYPKKTQFNPHSQSSLSGYAQQRIYLTAIKLDSFSTFCGWAIS